MASQSLLDSIWVLFSAFLVFFMHAGFALVESGFCREKNAVMVLMKNVAVVAVSSILFYLVGYGVMFGTGNEFMGLSLFMPRASWPDVGTLPIFVFLFFQLVFAATACTIVSGALNERTTFGGFLAFTAVATTLIYPIVGHWVWGGGFLSKVGYHDFAGSSVVHVVGGAMALAGVMAVGPRIGKYGPDGRPRPLPAHNFPLATLGVIILWLGWFGFNGGSTLAANPALIGSVVLVTNLSAAAGFLAALGHVKLRTGMLDLSMALNGALGGLVAITAGADVIGPGHSLVVGAVAGVLIVEGVFLLDELRLDDPVGAIAVHGVGGIFGTLAVGLFASEGGLLVDGGTRTLGVQVLGCLAIVFFAFSASAAVWFGMKRFVKGSVRVPAAHELEGLDLSECGVEAYGRELSGISEAPLAPETVAVARSAPMVARS
ncbi:MAG: ammonium transporter [Polyangiales bacterium]